MTRDDIFWLCQRLVGLYLVFQAISAAPGAIASFGAPVAGGVTAGQLKLEMVVPLIAAIVIFAWSGSRADAAGSRDVHFSMQREDLLWVGVKLLGLYWLFALVGDVLFLLNYSFGGEAFGPLSWVLPAFVVHFAAVWFLVVDERLWRLACRGGNRTQPPAGPDSSIDG